VKKPAAAETAAAAQGFERRADRARLLAGDSPAAADALRFAAALFGAQGEAAAALEAKQSDSPLTASLAQDLDRLEGPVRSIYRAIAARGPEALGAEAAEREGEDPSVLRSRLSVYWAGDLRTAEDYLSRAALRPYLELIRARGLVPNRIHRRGHCPGCGAPPAISWRRDGSDAEGARRYLGCLLCGAEWLFERILCPSCFEEDPLKLPSFQSDKHPAARVEACETCQRYVKSIDLSLDARPIPEVDDLVSLSMDLWAAEEGWTRIEPGWAGV